MLPARGDVSGGLDTAAIFIYFVVNDIFSSDIFTVDRSDPVVSYTTFFAMIYELGDILGHWFSSP